MSNHSSFQMTPSQWADSCTFAREVAQRLGDLHEDMYVVVGNAVYLRNASGQKFAVTVEAQEG